MARKNAPPKAPGLPLVGNLPAFAKNPLAFFSQLHDTYGDVVRFSFQGDSILISHPDDIEQVLRESGKRFEKGYAKQGFSDTLTGVGLAASEGEVWKQHRKLVAPAFQHKHIGTYAQTMIQLTQHMLEEWHDQEARDIHKDMMLLTQQIVTQTLFGIETRSTAEQVNQSFDCMMHEMQREVDSWEGFLPNFIITPSRARLKEAVGYIDQVIYHILRERRTHPSDTNDMLSLLMQVQDEEGNALTDQEIRDEMHTFYFAGHETTANNLTWAWMLLSTHTAVRAQLETELDQVLGGRLPTAEDTAHLPYTAAILKEALRLYPPAWTFYRVASEDVEVGGYPIAKGTRIWLSPWVTHRDARWFEDPEAFKPARWLDGLEKRLPKYAYFPFGGGPRICIGNGFALMEGALLLSIIAQRYRFSLLEDQDLQPKAYVTLRPKHGLRVRLEARKKSVALL